METNAIKILPGFLRESRQWFIFVIFILLLIITLVLWQQLDILEDERISHSIQLDANNFGNELQALITPQVRALNRMASRWEFHDGVAEKEWRADASNYLRHQPGLQAIEWVDAGFTVRWIEPLEGNERALNQNLSFEEHRREAMQAAMEQRSAVFSKSITLVQGGEGKGVLVFVPIFQPISQKDTFSGFILGVFNLSKLISPVSSRYHERGYSILISENEQTIFEHVNNDVTSPEWERKNVFSLGNLKWQILLRPSRAFVASKQSWFPELALLIGLILTILLTIVLYLLHQLRLKSRSALAESEARFSGIVEYADDGIISIDDNQRIILFNKSAECIFGYQQNEVLNRPLTLLIPEKFHEHHKEHVRKFAHQKIPARMMGERNALYGLRKDGSEFLLEASISRLTINGKLIYTAIFRDITERKYSEQSLLKLNRVLKILNACNETMIRNTEKAAMMNDICRIIHDIAGYPWVWAGFVDNNENMIVEEIAYAGIGHEFFERFKLTCVDDENGQHPPGQAIRNGKTIMIRDIASELEARFSESFKIPEGAKSMIALPLKSGSKAFGVICIFGSLKNIFDENEINLMEKIANNVAFGLTVIHGEEHRNELQKQVQQIQKMEAIGQLTGGIAHDFNNILATVIGYTGLAIEQFVVDSNSKLSDYLNQILSASNKAKELIRQMLIFSRGESTEYAPLRLQSSIKEAIRMMRGTLPSNIELHTFIEDIPQKVLANPVQLHQVIMNLFINARDAITGNGYIEVRLNHVEEIKKIKCSSCHETIEGDFVELVVTDNGSGIGQDIQQRMFDPFFSTKESGKGTGMGLSMVHGIIHNHRGHIIATSKPTVGTSFQLLFPVFRENKAISTDSEDLINKQEKPDDISRHILIVDDEKSVANFLSELVTLKGYQATVETSSRNALKTFKQHLQTYDLVITDQTMPGLTGIELAVKMLELRPGLPIILCSGYTDQINESQARDIGICEFINKPMDSHILLERVEYFLSKAT